MTKILPIVVGDAARARFFTYDPGDALFGRAPSLVEQAVLIDLTRGPREIEVDRRFAVQVAHKLEELITSNSARRAVIVASPRLLGLMRPSLSPLAGRGVELEAIDRDLTRETPTQLHDHLATLGYLPPRTAQRETR